MDLLKQCPFCKATDVGIELRHDGLHIADSESLHPHRYIAYSAICNCCGARGPIAKVSDFTHSDSERFQAVETAAHLWNHIAVAAAPH